MKEVLPAYSIFHKNYIYFYLTSYLKNTLYAD
jgi:hypothetical protein